MCELKACSSSISGGYESSVYIVRNQLMLYNVLWAFIEPDAKAMWQLNICLHDFAFIRYVVFARFHQHVDRPAVVRTRKMSGFSNVVSSRLALWDVDRR